MIYMREWWVCLSCVCVSKCVLRSSRAPESNKRARPAQKQLGCCWIISQASGPRLTPVEGINGHARSPGDDVTSKGRSWAESSLGLLLPGSGLIIAVPKYYITLFEDNYSIGRPPRTESFDLGARPDSSLSNGKSRLQLEQNLDKLHARHAMIPQVCVTLLRESLVWRPDQVQ